MPMNYTYVTVAVLVLLIQNNMTTFKQCIYVRSYIHNELASYRTADSGSVLQKSILYVIVIIHVIIRYVDIITL